MMKVSLFRVSLDRLRQGSDKLVVYRCLNILLNRSYCISAIKFGDNRRNEEAVRNAQATEIFRASYLSSSKSSTRVSTSDLDDLLTQQRARPSIFLPLLHLGGFSLGILSRVLPETCSTTLNNVIHEATIQQFNDTIRDLSSSAASSVGEQSGSHVVDDSFSEEIKDTMKYHRDIETEFSYPEPNSSPVSENFSASTNSEASSETHANSSDSVFNPLVLGATSTMYNALKATRVL
jgi:hypothetical protein